MSSIQLTYCTNVHALGDAEAWHRSLAFFGPAVRAHLMRENAGIAWKSMPLGLWWQAPLAQAALQDVAGLGRFLAEHGLRAFTCNAFPYGDFHGAVVKTKVYHPDWTSPQRLQYTQNCASLLASLLPEGGFGSISTLPLGWRQGWTPDKTRAAVAHLLAFAAFAAEMEAKTGKRLALALEPEPGCALERTPQVLRFWRDDLLPAAHRSGQEASLSRYLGLCYDTCHQAVQFENPEAALAALHGAGIAIHKMQLSSALEFRPDASGKSLAARQAFAEPKFLHQTRIAPVTLAGNAGGESTGLNPEGVQDFDDLPEALEKAAADWERTWRTHYHLPLQAETLLDSSAVRTTRDDMVRAYRYALAHDLCRHFEVETYTWSVLPPSERPQGDAALAEALAREIEFVISQTPKGVEING